MNSSLVRFFSLTLVITCFTTQVAFASKPEAEFWAERRLALAPTSTPPLHHQVGPMSLATQHHSLPRTEQFLAKAISPRFASILESYSPSGNKNSPILLLQDVHLNTEAQSNIAGVLQELIDQNLVRSIGVEGAFEPFDFSQFRSFPDKEIIREGARAFFEHNYLAAPSLVGITSPTEPPLIVGVDDWKLYQANFQANLDSKPHQAVVIKQLDDLDRTLKKESQTAFSADLKWFDSLRSEYRANRIGLGEYLEKTMGKAPSPVIHQFLTAYRLERQLDFHLVQKEQTAAIENLAKHLDQQELSKLMNVSVSYRLGQIGSGDYYAKLERLFRDKGIALEKAPAFNQYIQYVLLSDALNAEELLAAIELAERKLVESLATSPQEKKLMRDKDWVSLAKKLVQFSLTPREWDTYRQLNSSAPSPNLRPFEAFYKHADRRSEKMVENLLKYLVPSTPYLVQGPNSNVLGTKYQVPGTAVLVAGGFHTPHLTQLLRKRQIPYVVASPKITKLDDSDTSGSAYLSHFSQEKTPLDKLFAGEKLFVNPPHVAIGTTKEPLARSRTNQLVLANGVRHSSKIGDHQTGELKFRRAGEFVDAEKVDGSPVGRFDPKKWPWESGWLLTTKSRTSKVRNRITSKGPLFQELTGDDPDIDILLSGEDPGKSHHEVLKYKKFATSKVPSGVIAFDLYTKKPLVEIPHISTNRGSIIKVDEKRFVLAREAEDTNVCFYSPHHLACLSVSIKAYDRDGDAWLGHAHIYPYYDVDYSDYGSNDATIDRLTYLMDQLRNEGFQHLQLAIGANARFVGFGELRDGTFPGTVEKFKAKLKRVAQPMTLHFVEILPRGEGYASEHANTWVDSEKAIIYQKENDLGESEYKPNVVRWDPSQRHPVLGSAFDPILKFLGKDSWSYRFLTTTVVPIVEAKLFQDLGLEMIPQLLIEYGVGSTWAASAGILWATVLFSFSHLIVRWLVQASAGGWSGWQKARGNGLSRWRSWQTAFSFAVRDIKLNWSKDWNDAFTLLGLSALFTLPFTLMPSMLAFPTGSILHGSYNALVLAKQLPSWMPVASTLDPLFTNPLKSINSFDIYRGFDLYQTASEERREKILNQLMAVDSEYFLLPYKRTAWMKRLTSEKNALLIALNDKDEVVGFLVSADKESDATILMIAVDKQIKLQGLASSLMDIYLDNLPESIKEISWVSLSSSYAFYHHYLKSRADFTTGTNGKFVLYRDTRGQLSPAQIAEQEAHVHRIEGRRKRLIVELQDLEGTFVLKTRSEMKPIEIGKNENNGPESDAFAAMINILSFEPDAELWDRGTLVVPAFPEAKKERVVKAPVVKSPAERLVEAMQAAFDPYIALEIDHTTPHERLNRAGEYDHSRGAGWGDSVGSAGMPQETEEEVERLEELRRKFGASHAALISKAPDTNGNGTLSPAELMDRVDDVLRSLWETKNNPKLKEKYPVHSDLFPESLLRVTSSNNRSVPTFVDLLQDVSSHQPHLDSITTSLVKELTELSLLPAYAFLSTIQMAKWMYRSPKESRVQDVPLKRFPKIAREILRRQFLPYEVEWYGEIEAARLLYNEKNQLIHIIPVPNAKMKEEKETFEESVELAKRGVLHSRHSEMLLKKRKYLKSLAWDREQRRSIAKNLSLEYQSPTDQDLESFSYQIDHVAHLGVISLAEGYLEIPPLHGAAEQREASRRWMDAGFERNHNTRTLIHYLYGEVGKKTYLQEWFGYIPWRAGYMYVDVDLETMAVHRENVLFDVLDELETQILRFERKENHFQIIVPILPTVYNPASPAIAMQDEQYIHAITKFTNHYKTSYSVAWPGSEADRIAVWGPGTGFDTLVAYLAWLKASNQDPNSKQVRKPLIDVRDVSPFANKNTELLGQLAGFPVRIGFRESYYDVIISNSKSYEEEDLHARMRPHSRALQRQYDDDTGGAALIDFSQLVRQSADSAPAERHPLAITWNTPWLIPNLEDSFTEGPPYATGDLILYRERDVVFRTLEAGGSALVNESARTAPPPAVLKVLIPREHVVEYRENAEHLHGVDLVASEAFVYAVYIVSRRSENKMANLVATQAAKIAFMMLPVSMIAVLAVHVAGWASTGSATTFVLTVALLFLLRSLFLFHAERTIHGRPLSGGPNDPGLMHTKPNSQFKFGFNLPPLEQLSRTQKNLFKAAVAIAFPHELLHMATESESEIAVTSLEFLYLTAAVSLLAGGWWHALILTSVATVLLLTIRFIPIGRRADRRVIRNYPLGSLLTATENYEAHVRILEVIRQFGGIRFLAGADEITRSLWEAIKNARNYLIKNGTPPSRAFDQTRLVSRPEGSFVSLEIRNRILGDRLFRKSELEQTSRFLKILREVAMKPAVQALTEDGVAVGLHQIIFPEDFSLDRLNVDELELSPDHKIDVRSRIKELDDTIALVDRLKNKTDGIPLDPNDELRLINAPFFTTNVPQACKSFFNFSGDVPGPLYYGGHGHGFYLIETLLKEYGWKYETRIEKGEFVVAIKIPKSAIEFSKIQGRPFAKPRRFYKMVATALLILGMATATKSSDLQMEAGAKWLAHVGGALHRGDVPSIVRAPVNVNIETIGKPQFDPQVGFVKNLSVWMERPEFREILVGHLQQELGSEHVSAEQLDQLTDALTSIALSERREERTPTTSAENIHILYKGKSADGDNQRRDKIILMAALRQASDHSVQLSADPLGYSVAAAAVHSLKEFGLLPREFEATEDSRTVEDLRREKRASLIVASREAINSPSPDVIALEQYVPLADLPSLENLIRFFRQVLLAA